MRTAPLNANILDGMSFHGSLKPIREFSFPSSAPYLLDMFGGTFQNPNDPWNPLIECFLTPCEPREGLIPGISRKLREQVRVGIGVGNLTNLYLGRFVQNGTFTETAPIKDHRPERITFEFDTRSPDSEEIWLGDLAFEDRGAPLSRSHAQSGVRSPVKLLHGKILQSDRLNEREGNKPTPADPWPLTVMIHEFELIRFYYSNSSNLCRAVFGNAFTKDHLTKAVVAGEPSFAYDKDTDTHSFIHRLGFTDEDMSFLGRILCEPDETALRGVRRIYESSRSSRLNAAYPGRMAYPRTLFPFQQKVQISLTGHRARLKDGSYLFIVHHIGACSSVFPFRKLRYASVRATGVVDPKIEPQGPEPPRPRLRSGPVHNPNNAQGTIRSDMPPAADSIPISCDVGSRVFSGLSSVKLIRENRTVPVAPQRKRAPRYDPRLIDLSAGQAGHGSSTAARLIQQDRVEKGTLTADLSTFIKVMHELGRFKPSWDIKSIEVGDECWSESDISRGFFPLVKCPIRQSMFFKFSYVDDQRTDRRQLIGMQIKVENSFVYLFEAQRRQANTGEPGAIKYREELPVLLLRRPLWEPIQGTEITQMLRDTVASPGKTWPVKVEGFVRDSIAHGMGADTPEKLAERIAMVIKRNIPQVEIDPPKV